MVMKFKPITRGGQHIVNTVPFKEILPLKLRNNVSGKSSQSTSVACIQEMSVLFACLKKNDFNEAVCASEVSAFQKCYNDNVALKRRQVEQERKGILVPGEKRLSHKQANELLKIYRLK